MQVVSLILAPVLRAAIVRGYRNAFNLDAVAKKPRPISFEQAMRIRAAWVCGEAERTLADRHFKGRTDSLRPLLSGLGYMSPTASELATAADVLNKFYQALDDCTFAPVGAEVAGYLLPIENFKAGQYEPAAVPETQGVEKEETEPIVKPAAKAEEAEPTGLSIPNLAKWRVRNSPEVPNLKCYSCGSPGAVYPETHDPNYPYRCKGCGGPLNASDIRPPPPQIDDLLS
jgi:hypothetical protein